MDISFSPLAMPMLSGPGSIAVTLGFTSLATDWTDYLAIIAGIVTVALLTYAVLRVSGRLVRFIGPVGVNAMTKIMGFLIMSIGVQFVVNGVIGVATDPELLAGVRRALGGG
jgi:multiple antibiotic resistance protein